MTIKYLMKKDKSHIFAVKDGKYYGFVVGLGVQLMELKTEDEYLALLKETLPTRIGFMLARSEVPDVTDYDDVTDI